MSDERDDDTIKRSDEPDSDTLTFVPSPSPRTPLSAPERFTPGTILGERYRIVSALGAGGMGEVYQAQDMKLGQTVALKFIARHLARDPRILERIVAEVRIGRQVSHPNVCRIYDIGEIGDLYFISMEYVAGEDLASLLRRIRRLSEEKALEFARDLCAGLAAAHDKGVIHRDLKPANVMIDDRGAARVTDFGLAVLQSEGESNVAGGTPAYMAPEQLDGEAATEQSDIYSFGLILYELFTGQRVFEGTVPEIVASHSTPKRLPSSLVKRIDPNVERLILRCLEETPADRPQSVREVMAALPGGDPLRAAVAAGETPSPRMVAAAEAQGDISVGRAWTWMVAALCVWGLIIGLTRYSMLYRQVPLEKSPDVLTERARQLIRAAGYEPQRSSSTFFIRDFPLLKLLSRTTKSIDRSPIYHAFSPIRFVYRESPVELFPLQSNRISEADPALNVAGMVSVTVDSNGRLVQFVRVPEASTTPGAGRFVGWDRWFAEAGLNRANLRPSGDPWTSPVDQGEKWSWTGTLPAKPALPIVVHAATYDNHPVFFDVEPVLPMNRAALGGGDSALARRSRSAGFAVVFTAIFAGSALVARRNLRLGRVDRSGARKLAFFVFTASLVASTLFTDHTPVIAVEWFLFVRNIGQALFDAASMWLFYIAVEPYVRRREPELLISWSRLLAGRFHDPLVGRDILLGCLFGTLVNLFFAHLAVSAPGFLGAPLPLPNHQAVEKLAGGFYSFAILFGLAHSTPVQTVGLLFVFAAVKSIVKRTWIAAAAVVVCSVLPFLGFGSAHDSAAVMPFIAVSTTLVVTALVRFGLLAGTVALFSASWVNTSLFIFDPSSWLFLPSLFCMAVFLGLLVYGFYTSLGFKPVLGKLRVAD